MLFIFFITNERERTKQTMGLWKSHSRKSCHQVFGIPQLHHDLALHHLLLHPLIKYKDHKGDANKDNYFYIVQKMLTF